MPFLSLSKAQVLWKFESLFFLFDLFVFRPSQQDVHVLWWDGNFSFSTQRLGAKKVCGCQREREREGEEKRLWPEKEHQAREEIDWQDANQVKSIKTYRLK